ncbi:MAG: oligosaccharide flippase family protein [Candidatus Pacebacteria bacterium]|jgi:putative peptidoglycan lipid II flippase|nr:oligosaccharide flippase family protein [Candidatus Paceibacterota bacterium]
MVTRVLNILYREVRGLHQAAYVIALFTLASQILAVVRDRILAHEFGAGYELDIYYAAFRIPDLLFVLFASVLSVYVLLPFVTRAESDKPGSGSIVLTQFFSLFLVLYSGIAIVVYVFAPLIVPYVFPGFTPEAYTEIVLLLRVLLLQPFFLGLSSLYGVVTQIHHRFVLYALSPLLYNIGIIIGALLLYPLFGLVGLAYGVVLGAIGHMLVQWPLVRRSTLAFGLVWRIDWRLVLEVTKIALPRALTLSCGQLQMLVFVMLASTMAVGSVAVLQLAYNLQSVPLAIIGMSYSVAAFPVLAELLAKKEENKFISYVATALRHIIFWSVPIAALIIVLRAQIVRVLLGSGSFNWDDTRLTAAALAIFVVALLGQAILLVLIRAFYAGGYTKVPLIVTALGATIGAGSAYYLTILFRDVPTFAVHATDLLRLSGVSGVEVLMIPLGFLIGVMIELVLLLIFFGLRFPLPLRVLGMSFVRALLAGVVGATIAYLALAFVVEGVNQEKFIGIFIQGVTGGVLGLCGVVATYALMRSPELSEAMRSFKARIWKTDVVAPQPDLL